MIPGELIDSPKSAKRRRRHGGYLSGLLSGAVFATALLLSASRAYLPSPAESFPLDKTAEAPADRELLLLASDGKPFARRGGCYDRPVTIDEVPRALKDALIATEDRRFYSHFGIDPFAVVRAAATNYAAGKIVQGGSTITQQLAKISYLSSARSYDRKIREAIAVLRLEIGLTKNRILERYLSRAYFGEGCFGLRAAARKYFNRKVPDLTTTESAVLVALLKSPGHLSQDNEALRSRKKIVLDAMVADGRLTPAKRASLKPARPLNKNEPALGGFYADWIADVLVPPRDGSAGALPVRTGLDRKLQSIAERTVRDALHRGRESGRTTQAALVAMRPDGKVVAMVGGTNYESSQFNRAVQALRQPGSSFKAFVYLAALRAGAQPDMLVVDEPVTIGDWSPKNYDEGYRGVVPLSQAFSSSINTIAVKLTHAVGPERVAAAARDLGITTPMSHDNPSIALGTSEVTLLDLTSAYAAFAAGSYPVKPWGVLSLGANAKASVGPPRGAGEWMLPETGQMRAFLEGVVQYGTGRAARLPIPSYGKTGTSQSYRDAWYIGFAGNLVVGVWVGNDDNSPMRGVTGGSLPAQIWKDFMEQARHKDRNFKPVLPQRIAAFPAKLPGRADTGEANAALNALDVRHMQYAWRPRWGGAYYGEPMMLGRPDAGYGGIEPEYQWGSPPGRGREAWDPFVPR